MVLDQLFSRRGHVPEKVGRDQRQEDGMMVAGLLEEAAEVVLDLRDVGRVEDDVDRRIAGAEGPMIVLKDRNAVQTGLPGHGMAGVDFTHSQDADPPLSHLPEFFVETGSDPTQTDQKNRNRFHPLARIGTLAVHGGEEYALLSVD